MNTTEQYDRVRRDHAEVWHVVESTISGAAITNCGRRMEPKADRGELTWASEAEAGLVDEFRLCFLCGEGRRLR